MMKPDEAARKVGVANAAVNEELAKLRADWNAAVRELVSAREEIARLTKEHDEVFERAHELRKSLQAEVDIGNKEYQKRKAAIARAEKAESELERLKTVLAKARKVVRGRHSTLSYGPKALLDEIDAALNPPASVPPPKEQPVKLS